MFDIVVIGAGHAGCEAALASCKNGFKTLLITLSKSKIASMPCNPSIGGPAKGIVVREIDALGGFMGKCADMASIQVKMLNKSKGPAVHSLRFQEDKLLYQKVMIEHLEKMENLTIKEGLVKELIINNDECLGVILNDDSKIFSKKVILTTGTYMDSVTLQGDVKKFEGPDGSLTSNLLSNQLKKLGFEIQRLKTGTPARVRKSSIDFTNLQVEKGDSEDLRFSFDDGYDRLIKKDEDCYLIYTNLELHNLILNNLDKSAMYSGNIKGIGPRYCPSIEDKVVRFKEKERHQIFLEPESLDLETIYVQGFSTSMSIDIQDKMLRLLPGFKNVEVIKYAYAIEYDSINPLELKKTLETKKIKNLYTAGQINGTSGYEEAAGQGLIAGINASLSLKGLDELILNRNEAYIGVLIDDLTTKGTQEPYRLLTSRAEYRLLLRNDNADIRLRKYGYYAGLISNDKYEKTLKKEKKVYDLIEEFKNIKVKKELIKDKIDISVLESMSIYQLLKRPDINIDMILRINDFKYDYDILSLAETLIKYEGYIKKSLQQASRMTYYEKILIPNDINYDKIINLALEAREKLKKIKPSNIGQASRISGVNPSDISVLLIYLKEINKYEQ